MASGAWCMSPQAELGPMNRRTRGDPSIQQLFVPEHEYMWIDHKVLVKDLVKDDH